MESSAILIAILILMPFVAGLLVAAIKDSKARAALVFVVTAVVAGASLVLLKEALAQQGPIKFTPLHAEVWGHVISLADFGLLGLFAYLGVKRRSILIVLLAIAQMIPLAWLEIMHRDILEPTATSPAFVVDWLSITMVLIISIIGSAVVVYAVPYMEDHEHHLHLAVTRQPRFFFFLTIFLGAMNGLVMANNLFWLYFFWEITTLCCVMLIGHDGTEEATTNSYRALWMNLIGGAAFVAAIVILATKGNDVTLQGMLQGHVSTQVLFLPLALLSLAGFTKAAQMPFQAWLLGAMVAPTPVSALLHSSTMVKAGVYLVIRIAPCFHSNNALGYAVAVVGAFTFVAGAMLAISQGNAKRVLAYSTISNLGLIIACAGLHTTLTISAALLLVIFHAVSKALLFMAAGVIEQGIGSREIEDMEGLMSRMPLTTVLTVIGILSMVLPPFGMVVAKWAAIEAAARSPVALVLFVAGSAFTVVFWTKWVGRLVVGSSGGVKPVLEKLHTLYVTQLGLTAFLAVVLSIVVSPMMDHLIIPAAAAFHGEPGFTPANPEALSWAMPMATPIVAGGFPFFWLFLIITGLFVVVTLLVQFHKPVTVPPYLCGENILEAPAPAFCSAKEESQPISIGGYYFDRLFGEKKHTPWINFASLLLLLVLFGIAWPK